MLFVASQDDTGASAIRDSTGLCSALAQASTMDRSRIEPAARQAVPSYPHNVRIINLARKEDTPEFDHECKTDPAIYSLGRKKITCQQG